MSNTAGDMVKSGAQPCEMARGVAQQFDMPRSDHPSFDMTRYVSQSSDMVRGAYQTFDMNKSAHQPYEMTRGIGHTFEMSRSVALPYDMPRTIPQSFEMSRGLHQAFDMPRGVAQQYDMSRSIGQPFEMPRSNTTYEMPRGPQGYEMTRDSQTPYEMPRTQPYEMRGVVPTIDMARGGMDVCHPFDYVKTYQQCPDPQTAGPAKAEVPHDITEAQQELEVPLEMPKTAPQSTVKAKGRAQKGISHPFDFAKGYAQQLEIAKRAAQNAIQAKIQAEKVEKARQEAEQAEKAKHEAEEAEKAKQEAEELENAEAAAQPSVILKLYTRQLEMMKSAGKPSEIAKMYAKQVEMAEANASKSEKTKKLGPYSERSRKGKAATLSVDKENCTKRSSDKSESASRSSTRKSEEMDTDESNDNQTEEAKGDPPPFEMAKYLAQLSKMTKGSAPPAEKDDSQSSEGGRSESQQSDTVKGETPSSTEVAKTSGLPFPFELMNNFGLPFGMGIGVGSPRAKRDRQELTIANKAKLIEQVEARGAKKKADIAREWGLRPSTLSTIMKNKDRIMTQFKSQRYAAGRRRMRTAAYPDVEEALLTWFRYARAANIPITGPVLQGMGVTLAQELGHPEFSCSVGWLDRFKARHGLSFNPKNNQDSGGGTFNEPADRQPSPLPSIPLEASSDSETSPSSWFPPSMPATGISASESADSSSNAWFSNALPNLNVASTAETQDQLNKWFPATVAGEHEGEPAAFVPAEDPTRNWFYSTVPSLFKDYKPRDIFSASEAALFYNLLPDKSLAVKGEDGHKWTWVKERLTLMVAVNMDGSEKLPLVVIGQMKDPRAFYNVEILPLPYEANDSAMMTSSIFENWVRQLDEQYQNLNRNIVILVDTCSAHPNIDNLRCVQLLFLPKEITSPLHPVEQGIIQSLKTLYRRYILERLIKCNEKGQQYEVTVLTAMELLAEAWKQVKTELIVNSFKQVGLEQIEELYDAKLGFEDEHALLERARRSGIDIPGDVTFEFYLNVDSQVQTTMELNEDGSTEADQLIRGDDGTGAGSVAGPIMPSEAMHALSTLRKFLKEQSGLDIFIEPLAELESWVANHIVKPEVSLTSE